MANDLHLHVGVEGGMMGLEEPIDHYRPEHLRFGDDLLVAQRISARAYGTFVPGFLVDRWPRSKGWDYRCEPVSESDREAVMAFLAELGYPTGHMWWDSVR